MFYYYGRKKRLAASYPEPQHDRIIEPFAGSAAYSLHGDRWERDVWINDLDPHVTSLWRYLQAADAKDIESLPMLEPGELLSSVTSLTDDERLLISLHIGPGKNRLNDVVSKFSRWGAGRRYIAANVHKIKHWTITGTDYSAMLDLDATWFIDPPYQGPGRLYRFHDIDYDNLGSWVRNREGLTIVCEQEGADWLPFVPLVSQKNAGRHISHEVVWTDGLTMVGEAVSSE